MPTKPEPVTMRTPFPPHQISKLPKPTKAQTEAVRADFKKGTRCTICGTWHHPDVVHLDYVGHAALTDRLLDVDPAWSWEPVAFAPDGLPAVDRIGGLWIRLTINGVTRLGYGDADGKTGGNAVKEAIGDALRNAAMRFGAALDLWHKGDLHLDEVNEESPAPQADMPDAEWANLVQLIEATKSSTTAMVKHFGVKDLKHLDQAQYAQAVEMLNVKLEKAAKAQTDAELADEIPY